MDGSVAEPPEHLVQKVQAGRDERAPVRLPERIPSSSANDCYVSAVREPGLAAVLPSGPSVGHLRSRLCHGL